MQENAEHAESTIIKYAHTICGSCGKDRLGVSESKDTGEMDTDIPEMWLTLFGHPETVVELLLLGRRGAGNKHGRPPIHLGGRGGVCVKFLLLLPDLLVKLLSLEHFSIELGLRFRYGKREANHFTGAGRLLGSVCWRSSIRLLSCGILGALLPLVGFSWALMTNFRGVLGPIPRAGRSAIMLETTFRSILAVTINMMRMTEMSFTVFTFLVLAGNGCGP